MVQVLITHATSQRNRLSIRMRGLLPRKTSEHNYPSYDNQPKGVFGRWFGDEPWWGCFGEDGRDIYLVDIAGLPTTRDAVLGDALVVIVPISPDRILERVEYVPEYRPLVDCITFAKAKMNRTPRRIPATLPLPANFPVNIDLPIFMMDENTKEF